VTAAIAVTSGVVTSVGWRVDPLWRSLTAAHGEQFGSNLSRVVDPFQNWLYLAIIAEIGPIQMCSLFEILINEVQSLYSWGVLLAVSMSAGIPREARLIAAFAHR